MNYEDYMNDSEVTELSKLLAEPIFKFFIRRMQKVVHANHPDMPMQIFTLIFMSGLSSLNANLLRWLESFHKVNTGKDVNFFALKKSLDKRIDDALKELQR